MSLWPAEAATQAMAADDMGAAGMDVPELRPLGADAPAIAPATAPAIVLVAPQLGENIGTAARAMLNFGLTDLRLVAPRDGWPNARAEAAASGATAVIAGARVFAQIEDAIAGSHHVLATTARARDMFKPVLTPEQAARSLRAWAARGERSAVLFGPERTGLDNDAVSLAEAIIRVPVNPDFPSLNLAQAVLLLGYEWFKRQGEQEGQEAAGQAGKPAEPASGPAAPARAEDLLAFFEHLEGELDRSGFLHPPEKRASMVRNIRNIFLRAGLRDQEVRTLRGIVATLVQPKSRREGRMGRS